MDIHTMALPLLTWIIISWHHARFSITVITAKLHNEWNTLDEVSLLLHKIGMVQWIIISMTKVTQITFSLFLTLRRSHLTLSPENSFYKVLPLITGWHHYILLGIQNHLKRTGESKY